MGDGCLGEYKYSNAQVTKILGYRPEEIVGRTPKDVGIIREDPRLEATLASRGRDAIEHFEYDVFHRDGTARRMRTYAGPSGAPTATSPASAA